MCQSELTESFFGELNEFAAELSEFSLLAVLSKQSAAHFQLSFPVKFVVCRERVLAKFGGLSC